MSLATITINRNDETGEVEIYVKGIGIARDIATHIMDIKSKEQDLNFVGRYEAKEQ